MTIDIHNMSQIRNFAIEEAMNFKKPEYFCGGRFQTKHENIFLHINAEGNLSKIEINKKGGTIMYLKVPRNIRMGVK